MQKIMRITRRARLGFGYNSACVQVWNKAQTESRLEIEKTTSPCYYGTIKQLSKMIQEDKTLASYRSGTYYTTAYFVWHGKKWHRIVNNDENSYAIDDLSVYPYVDVTIE